MTAEESARADTAPNDEPRVILVPEVSRGTKYPTKRRHRKVRTGCSTWIRRVKCDEAKPACLKCKSTGRRCDGYSTSSPEGQDPPHSHFANNPTCRMSLEQNMASLCIRNRLLDFPGSKDEHRAIDFFYRQTAPILAGYFDSDFWRVTLPQAGCSEPCIQHAMIALASLQEHSDIEEPMISLRNANFRFALTQYNKSIRFLGQRLSTESPSHTTTLISCILFVCIEFLRGNVGGAAAHIDSGLAILRAQTSGNGNSSTESIETNLTETFFRLSVQNSLCGRAWSPLPRKAAPEGHQSYHRFTSLLEARSAITIIMHLTHGFIRSCLPLKLSPASLAPPGSLKKRDALIGQLGEWKSSFDIFMNETLTACTSSELHASTILLILHLISKIWMATSMEAGETAWDEHAGDFEAIVSLAEKLTGLQIDQEQESKVKVTVPLMTENCTWRDLFTFEMGAMPAVYFTALKCRCPIIRRRAMRVLARMRPRREGLWDARQLGAIAKRVVELEEWGGYDRERCDGSGWVGEKHRVLDAMIGDGFLDGRLGQEVQFLTRPGGLDGGCEVRTEYIAWK